jgi:cell wall-associated NlpC family hydrolase
LFFGEKSSTIPEKFHVVHVGIYMGNKQFIHSSEKVKISSLDPQSTKFDSYNTRRLIGAKRIIGTKESNYWNYFTYEWNR